MKFCKTCDKKLPKDENLDECFKCQYTKEKENFECDFMDDEGLTCIYQYNMFRRGYVMDCEGNWLTPEDVKKYPRPEELQDYVDWLHIHCTGGCIEYFKHVEPKEYLSMIKEFKSESEYLSECQKLGVKP